MSTPDPNEQTRARGALRILSNEDELRDAVIQVTGLANRGLSILTPDLEPSIYDRDEFLDALKRFVLARSYARVRVLISDPHRTLKSGNRLVDMGRRLNTYIDFRNLRPEYRDREDAYFIADDFAIVYRAQARSWDGMVDTYAPAVARKYLTEFDALWQACGNAAELRQMRA